nr:pentatricopeptide repeat-containing protein [Quercus suber]
MGSKAMFKWSKQITPSLVEQLIRAERDVQKAVLIFDSATAEYANGFQHDHNTFGLMISKLISSNQFRSAEELLNRMKEEKCNITEDIFLSICRAYGRVHRPLDAVRVFHKMDDFQCKPTEKSYITSNDLDEAIGLLEEMIGKGIDPNVFTYSALMDGFCKGGHSSQAMELLEMMISKRQRPNMITYSTLIHGLCKEGKLREALEILDRMKLQGLKPDAGLYMKIINGFCDVFKFQEAANFLDEMVLGGISPNRLTWSLHVRIYNMVVQGLCTNGDPNRAFQLYLSMRSRGISINTGTFDSLVECFCKRGDLHKAARIVDEMVIDGCVPAEGTWNAVNDRSEIHELRIILSIQMEQNLKLSVKLSRKHDTPQGVTSAAVMIWLTMSQLLCLVKMGDRSWQARTDPVGKMLAKCPNELCSEKSG